MPLARTPWIGRPRPPAVDRRALLAGVSSASVALMAPLPALAGAAGLARTPRQTEGPFYPVDWSGDTDNDLVIVTGEAAKAMGEVIHVSGRVLDTSGQAVAGARVEIWQCDANGVYRHPRDTDESRRVDGNFQGRGRTIADATGRYTFRTIRPVPYPGRTPHIHFRIDSPSGLTLVTQMYVAGEPLNARDGILNGIRESRQRESVIVPLEPAEGREPGALGGTFDIVLG